MPNAILLLLLGGVFVHFMIAGGRTFYFKTRRENEPAAYIAQFSFLVTGTMVTWGWASDCQCPRRTRWPRRWCSCRPCRCTNGHATRSGEGALAWRWGDHVPETLCEEGPYRYIRHPIYLSYVLAFLAVLVALPHWITALTFLFNLALFVCSARSDERGIAGSALAADYAAYRKRTGMFLPESVAGSERPDEPEGGGAHTAELDFSVPEGETDPDV